MKYYKNMKNMNIIFKQKQNHFKIIQIKHLIKEWIWKKYNYIFNKSKIILTFSKIWNIIQIWKIQIIFFK